LFNQVQQQFADEEDHRARWSDARTFVNNIVKAPAFDISMSSLVVLNLAFVILEVNHAAKQEDSPTWIAAANFGVLFVYFVEVILKLFAFRKEFFCDPLSLLDLLVITSDLVVTIIVLIMPISLAPLVLARVARVLKITRALRMLAIFPEMNVLLKGIFYAGKTILWGVMLLLALLCFWSIFATLFIHPIIMEMEREGYWAKLDCERCARSFASVELSMLTFTQQLIVGEGWSEVNTPLIERHPGTAVFFVSVLVSLTLAALNLLMGVIVERASEAKAVTDRELASKKDQEREAASSKLLALCHELDEDKSGCLTLEELKRGFQESEAFSDMMRVMDIEERDIDVVYSMLDTDGSGDVEYKEFVDQLYMLKNHEAHTLLVFIKFYVLEIRARLNQVTSGKSQIGFPMSPMGNKGDAATSAKQSPRSNSVQEPVSLAWPELEAELNKLSELRQEVLDFSSSHLERLSRVQVRIAETAREPRSATAQKIDGGSGVGAMCSDVGSTRQSTPGLTPVAEEGGAQPRSAKMTDKVPYIPRPDEPEAIHAI